MYHIESAGLTDVGMRRKNNEDSLFLDDKKQFYVVADGMGGHQAGEVASSLVVETLWDYIKRFNGNEEVEELEDHDDSLSKEANRLLSGIHLANKSVYQASQNNETYRGMNIPESVIQRLDQAADGEREGLNIAAEIVDALKSTDGVRGFHFWAKAREKSLPELLELTGLSVK